MGCWRTAAGALLAASVAAGPAAAQTAGDPVRGKTVFAQCTGCHNLTGPSFAAPALAGVVGRKAGTATGFRYSGAMTASGIFWNDQTLDSFLAAPTTAVSGTSMPIGLMDARDRADVIAYLETVPAPGG